MIEAYLTIDDAPTPRTNELLAFLKQHKLQAQFFCRGDFMEEHPDAVCRAIKDGHIISNHLYSHRPASTLGYDIVIEEIEKTEALIDQCYAKAGIPKPGKYLRFPYLDRGNGAKTEQEFYKLIEDAKSTPKKTPKALDGDLVRRLQTYLKKQGYTQPYQDITHPLYQIPAIRDAADCFLTFTSYDWMLSPRHLGKHPYTTTDDLKNYMEKDLYILEENNVSITLFHDDKEGIISQTCELISYMMERGVKFRTY